MSAPAMKPASLPERKISAFGCAASQASSTRASSAITSADSTLVEDSALSSVAQQMPSASVSSFQCFMMTRLQRRGHGGAEFAEKGKAQHEEILCALRVSAS